LFGNLSRTSVQRPNERLADIISRQPSGPVLSYRCRPRGGPARGFPFWSPAIDGVLGAGPVHSVSSSSPTAASNDRTALVGQPRRRHAAGLVPGAGRRGACRPLPTLNAPGSSIAGQDPRKTLLRHGPRTENGGLASLWKDVSGMLGLTALLIAAISRAAICGDRPGRCGRRGIIPWPGTVRTGLSRGDLSWSIAELSPDRGCKRISEVFNALAENLDRTTRGSAPRWPGSWSISRSGERSHLAAGTARPNSRRRLSAHQRGLPPRSGPRSETRNGPALVFRVPLKLSGLSMGDYEVAARPTFAGPPSAGESMISDSPRACCRLPKSQERLAGGKLRIQLKVG